MATTPKIAADDLRELLPDWERHLRATGTAPSTIDTYLKSGRTLVEFLLELKLPTTAGAITHQHLERVFVAMSERPNKRTGKPVTAANTAKHYRHARQLFRWLHETEEEIEANPFDRLKAPKVVPPPVPIISDEYLVRLLATCKGNGFEQRRDTALIRCWLDTGVRAGGLAGLTEDDLNFTYNTMTVRLKGGRGLAVPFGHKTAEALRRYQRVRAKHTAASSAALWLGKKGPLQQGALNQMLNRRAADAGLPHMNPHMFRHLFAHQWLLNGGNESDLMRIMGWESRDMVTRYARSASEERARKAHQEKRLGDRV